MKKRNKTFTKLLCIALVCVMLVTSMGAYSGEIDYANSNGAIVTETNGVRTSITYDDVNEYKVVFDTINNTMQYLERNLSTDEIKAGPIVTTEREEQISVYSSFSQSTDHNYKYTVNLSTDEWYLQRPKLDGTNGSFYYKTYLNDSNDSELETFKDEVDELSSREHELYIASSAAAINNLAAGYFTALAIASGGILAPAAIAAIVEAVAVTAGIAILCEKVIEQCNKCYYAIEAVYYATDNMHF